MGRRNSWGLSVGVITLIGRGVGVLIGKNMGDLAEVMLIKTLVTGGGGGCGSPRWR